MKEKILERLTCFKDRVDELGGYTSKIICKEVATEKEKEYIQNSIKFVQEQSEKEDTH